MIPIYNINLSNYSIKNVKSCLTENWISSKGKFISRFEKKFSKLIKVNYASTVTNGTVALHLALLALGIKKDDEIIVPVLTYVAPVNAISYIGAKPVFVDADIDTWNIDAQKIEQKITKKTKAILAVHLYGFSCDILKIKKICKKYNLFLIEDVAEALGSSLNNKNLGTFGDVSTFSFYGNKTLTTGEGGMIITNKHSIFKKVSHLKNQAMLQNKKYFHDLIGYNYRMTNICAAIGCGELMALQDKLIKKKQIAEAYKYYLKEKNFIFQKELNNSVSSYWLISMLTNSIKNKKKIIKVLNKANIETRPIFVPMNKLPMYSTKKHYPVAEKIYSLGLSVPSYPDLSLKIVEKISKLIKKVN
jgi:perosamine synthetase